MGIKTKTPRVCEVILDSQDNMGDHVINCFLFNLAFGLYGELLDHSSAMSGSPLLFINYVDSTYAEYMSWNNVRKLLNTEGDIKYQLEVRTQVYSLRII